MRGNAGVGLTPVTARDVERDQAQKILQRPGEMEPDREIPGPAITSPAGNVRRTIFHPFDHYAV